MHSLSKIILLSSFIFISSMAYGAVNLTSHGHPINNGDVIMAECFKEELGDMKYYSWDPEIFISSDSGNQTVTVTFTSEFQGFSICWPMVCQDVLPGKSLTVKGEAGSDPRNMLIHCNLDSSNAPDFNISVPMATVRVTGGDGSSLEFTLQCLAPEDAGVDDITDSDKSIRIIYNEAGIPVVSFNKGLNLIIYSDGTVKKIFKN